MHSHKVLAKAFFNIVLILGMLLGPVGNLASAVHAAPAPAPAAAETDPRAMALVLVNSGSAKYSDFQHYIQPYLDHFGVPYTVVNIATTDLPSNMSLYSLLIIGHAQIDTGATARLSSTEQNAIVSAVSGGMGLVNFDNDLSANHSTGRYAFINSIFGFTYNANISGSNVSMPNAQSHWITKLHPNGDSVTTGAMTLAGIGLPGTMTALAATGSQPFLAVKTAGGAVQFGSYDWMSHDVSGPLMGLDDLVWRSMVWAARKPFVMQGMPPFVTFRIDDVNGPMDWFTAAIEKGFKPWSGVFYEEIGPGDTATLAAGIQAGNATASVHAKAADNTDFTNFFYFNHKNGTNLPDAEVAANFAAATAWHTTNNVPISKVAVGHYYEFGSNVFTGLNDWGIEFTTTMMQPGTAETGSWLQKGPFRLYETGLADDMTHNVTYADYLTIPGHPELDGQFFNCLTEIRDADPTTHYEWDPSTNIADSVEYGTEYITRGLDSMTLATLFSHEYLFDGVSLAQFRSIFQGITDNLTSYAPIYSTLDNACQYVRAVKASNISSAQYNTTTSQLAVSLSGTTDMETKFYVFTGSGSDIQQRMANVPVFNGATNVSVNLAEGLDHIVVSPATASILGGRTQQFTAIGYDSANNPISGVPFTWSVANGGGTIDANGLFTAGTTVGTYANTVTASSGGKTGTATVLVTRDRDCPCTVQPVTGVPENPGINDGPAKITAGMRFTSDIAGYISGVRFYKGANDDSTHQGRLYSSTGTLLSQATFENETDSGWQEVRFTAPVAIQADTTYIIAVYSNSGHFSFTSGGLVAGIDNAPLHVPAYSAEQPNSVYLYDDGFPTQNGTGANYWVDPVFDTVAQQRFSMWYASATPAQPSVTDGTPIETGTKFRSTVTGNITALRYYRGSGNTGTHTASLWNATTQQKLASAVFTSETPQGWQQVTLPTQVPIDKDTTYIVSVHSSEGFFAKTDNHLTSASQGMHLHALANSAADPNGVFIGSATPAFPTSSGNGNNYWTDVVFVPGAIPDITAPKVNGVNPAADARDVSINVNVSAAFSEAINQTTLTDTTVTLRDASNNVVPAPFTYDAASFTVTLNPTAALSYSTTYTLKLLGGTSGIKDAAGNALAADYTSTFTTIAAPPPPPSDGPGGPILVVGSSANPFGRYYSEILRTEGFNAYYTMDISAVNATVLASYDVVILGEMTLTAAQVTMLTTWVNGGGNLIAMRPDKQLASLLGLTAGTTTTANGYLLINTASAPGTGLVNQTIQFHGTADRYTINGATEVAKLYTTATNATTSPAVTLRSVGSNGGQAAAFTYDLARSVVYTRQGNPAWAGQERDGETPKRANDMFFGGTEADWIDFDKVQIPQADEQQRLLANMILLMNADRKPLPRFWYFPGNEKAVVIMTGDDHTGSGTIGRFERYLEQSPAGCSVDNWECVRATSYIGNTNPMTDTQAAQFNAQGFEIGAHLETGCDDFTPQQMEEAFATQLVQFKTKYFSIPEPVSLRSHCIVWPDWASEPKIEVDHGIRLDTNYYYWPGSWIENRPGLFTGSGMVMRFADTDGTLINVYQATTQLTDESDITYTTHINTLLDNALGANGYYAVITANMHNDVIESEGSEAIVAAAQARGVPVISARQMLNWLDGRSSSSFKNLAWNNNILTFTIEVGAGANRLRAMLPRQQGTRSLTSLTRSGTAVTPTFETIKGVQYLVFDAVAGSYTATYSADAGPQITNTTAKPNVTDGKVEWTTSVPATSRVDFGTTKTSLTRNVSDPALAATHSLTLTGLTAGTTYYYRVTSADAFGNSTTYPPTSTDPLSFKTASSMFSDTTDAEFGQGTVDGCYIGDGVKLMPTVGTEFSATTRPAGWVFDPPTGAETYNGSTAVIDGGLLATSALYNPVHVLDFEAQFTALNMQHIGFGTDLNDAPYAIFSTGNPATGSIWVRTSATGAEEKTELTTVNIAASHKFRIAWLADKVEYYVDGQLLATHPVAITAQMRPVLSDATGGGSLQVSYLRMNPYSASCSFQSRIFAAQGTAAWETISASPLPAAQPAETNYTLSYRTGGTPTPDGTWTAYTAVSPNGGALAGSSRYIQYKLDLTTTDPNVTPEIKEVRISYTAGPDTTRPTVTQTTPGSGATGVPVNTTVTATFSEAINPATLTTTTFRLRAQGSTTNIPATVTLNNVTATLTPTSPLVNGTVYTATLLSTVADTAGNTLGADVTWSFTTINEVIIDTTTTDFGAGTIGACLLVTNVSGGEIMLAPTTNIEFDAEPAGWALANNWSGSGTAVVSGGVVTVDGANYANKTTELTPIRAMEFYAKFSAQNFQHVGFAEGPNDYDGNWAIFSTHNGMAEEGIYARTGGEATFIPGNFLDEATPTRYRIEWYADRIVYTVNNTVVTHNIAVTANMHPSISDSGVGQPLVVDWMRLSPYPSTCQFTSRAINAGKVADWLTLTYAASVPTGTGLVFETRTGSSASGPWSSWAALGAANAIASPNGQYIQYRVTFNATNTALTPILESVSLELVGANVPQTFTKNLVTGWNLVSIPLIPSDTSPAAVLTSLQGNYDLVYAWDSTAQNWKTYSSAAPYGNTLTAIDNKVGFWIHMTAPDTLSVTGTLPTTTTIPMVSGWNLVGFSASAAKNLPDALSNNGMGTNFTSVFMYNATDTADPWKTFDRTAQPYANDLTQMSPGWGFWVRATAAGNWTVTYAAP